MNSISFEWFDFYIFQNCRTALKTVTGSRPKNFSVTNHGLALLAERQPRVRPAISTALLHRLAVINRHMIVWIGWVPSIP